MELITRYFPALSDTQLQQFQQLQPLYEDWNHKINVISRKDIGNFYEHHVLHSLAIAKAVQFVPDTRVLDVGTGGGFPGVPLAVLFPETEFVLVDSIGKKLRVIDAIAAEIGLTNVTTLHDRAENVPGKFNFITSRAVTRLNEAWGWVAHAIEPQQKNNIQNGMLYLKGGDISSELPHNATVERFELSAWFSEAYFSEKSLIHISKGV
jgi:16S rRNA (guanine527-N7)-methyltransferase